MSRTHYYKLPFVGPFSTYAQRRIKHLTRRYCKNLDIKLVFVPYKIKNLFSAKDAISKLSRSRFVYKFSCVGCGACCVGVTKQHLATRVREHLTSDKHSHIFQHIHGSETCRALRSEDCFSLLDTASVSPINVIKNHKCNTNQNCKRNLPINVINGTTINVTKLNHKCNKLATTSKSRGHKLVILLCTSYCRSRDLCIQLVF